MENQPTRRSQRDGAKEERRDLRGKLGAAKWYLALAVAVLFVGFAWYEIGGSPGTTGPEVQGELHHQDFKSLGQGHIPSCKFGEPAHNSNPPTSGCHDAQPAAWGIYDDAVKDEKAVHNLEHGGIWIAYNPDKISAEELEKLASVARDLRKKVLMAPRRDNPAKISLVAWTHLDELEEFDEGRIRAFYKAYKDKGPELIPD